MKREYLDTDALMQDARDRGMVVSMETAEKAIVIDFEGQGDAADGTPRDPV